MLVHVRERVARFLQLFGMSTGFSHGISNDLTGLGRVLADSWFPLKFVRDGTSCIVSFGSRVHDEIAAGGR